MSDIGQNESALDNILNFTLNSNDDPPINSSQACFLVSDLQRHVLHCPLRIETSEFLK